MVKAKQKAREPTLRNFVNAAVFDQPLAGRMLQRNPALLTDVNGIGETALADVVIENYLEAARFLLDAGADINTRDMSSETPLIQAAHLGYREMVALLLERGAQVNARDESQETALFQAARYGHAEVCEALLVAGAELNIQNDMEETLLDVILPRKREQVLGVLARHGYRQPVPPLVHGI